MMAISPTESPMPCSYVADQETGEECGATPTRLVMVGSDLPFTRSGSAGKVFYVRLCDEHRRELDVEG
jgi:hypothetical protein